MLGAMYLYVGSDRYLLVIAENPRGIRWTLYNPDGAVEAARTEQVQLTDEQAEERRTFELAITGLVLAYIADHNRDRALAVFPDTGPEENVEYAASTWPIHVRPGPTGPFWVLRHADTKAIVAAGLPAAGTPEAVILDRVRPLAMQHLTVSYHS